jgi:hypothetical protein
VTTAPALFYIEFYDRVPGVSLERFHAQALPLLEEWSRQEPEDPLIANLARTWRMGPYPHLLVWGCRGIARLDEWDRVFRSGDVDAIEDPILEVMRAHDAGFYRPLAEPRPVAAPAHYLETFTPWDGAGEHYAARAEAAGGELELLLARRGLLGPAPGGIALIGLPCLSAIDALAEGVPAQAVAAGTYVPVGDEVL